MIFSSFTSRSLETERIDRGEFTRPEYLRWQKEMWFIHRVFGEARALRSSLIRDIAAADCERLSVLDVGAGSGGLLTYVRSRVPGKIISGYGIEISQHSVRLIAASGNLAVRGSALSLPFRDSSIDFTFCTLLLHHLNKDDAAAMMREMRRVSRRKVYVIDLDRRLIPYLAYKILGRFLLQPFTREDGALSIKRAYRAAELIEIARGAGLDSVSVRASAIGRLVLTAEV